MTDMIETLRRALEACGIADWRVTEERLESAQLFFIKKDLDMRRYADTVTWRVKVYRREERDGRTLIGNADTIIAPDTSFEELVKKLNLAYSAAANALNPDYPIYAGPHGETAPRDAETADISLQDGARRMAEALLGADSRDGAFLNSAEIFSERTSKRIVSSAGTDVRFVRDCYLGEYIVQCKEPVDVEQYFDFRFTRPDGAALAAQVKEAFKTVSDRARADKMPLAGTYDLLLSDKQLEELMRLYMTRSTTGAVYAHYSDWMAGTRIQSENAAGEKLRLSVLPEDPYSGEGIPMKERLLIDDGVLTFLHGGARFAAYLGVEPTGTYRRMKLDNGTVPFGELKRGCLYPVSFSDFQMDPMSGRFGGEIRLAYLFTDAGTEVLTGGSVNGSLFEKQDALTFSLERYSDADYEGPLAVRIGGVAVNGRTEWRS